MDRRTFLGSSAASLAKLLAADQRRTNVLFILADEWRSSAFSECGDPMGSTPNFSRLAGDGVRWSRMYSANPVCTPNRSCILTGRFSHQHGMTHNDIMLPPGEKCIAEVFSEAGYATHYIGKWHMDGPEKPGFVPPGWRRRGFQTFEGFNRGHYYPAGAQYFTNDGEFLKPDIYEPTYQTDLAMAFMKRNRAWPFYCYLSWGPPHPPYRTIKEWDRYDPNKLAWRPNVPESIRADGAWRKNTAGYYGSCSALDYDLGRLMKLLEEEGLANNTLIVFTSDHGDMLGSHGLSAKSKPEDESLHIPLYMRLPGRIRGRQVADTLASSVDLTPTILSICGLKTPRGVAGKDLSAAALGGPKPKVDSIYAEGMMRANETAQARPAARKKAQKGGEEDSGPAGVSLGKEWRCLVTPSHKLAVRYDGTVAALWDMEKDPYEMKNLAGERSAAALEKDLLARLKRWGLETGDAFPRVTPPAKGLYTDEEAARAR
jgi:arylsulfatase A-like enzyme